LRSWSTRRSFTCSASGSSPISSRNSVPPSASLEEALLAPGAPVNAPFSWPKSSLSMSASGSAPQFTTTNGALLRWAPSWSARATTLLAGAALARDQHAARRASATRSTSLRTRCMASLLPMMPRRRPPLGAQRAVLVHQGALLERLLEGGQQLGVAERLLDVVVGALAHGVHGLLGGARTP
jgi:hypothetical protein